MNTSCSHEKGYQALPTFYTLQVTESWAEPGNEASKKGGQRQCSKHYHTIDAANVNLYGSNVTLGLHSVQRQLLDRRCLSLLEPV